MANEAEDPTDGVRGGANAVGVVLEDGVKEQEKFLPFGYEPSDCHVASIDKVPQEEEEVRKELPPLVRVDAWGA